MIQTKLPEQLQPAPVPPVVHLAILKEPYLEYIMQRKKTIESRFTKKRLAPFNRIKQGDIIYLKQSGGFVVAKTVAARVKFFELDEIVYHRIMRDYREELCVSPEFIDTHTTSKYATLIWLGAIHELDPPLKWHQEGQRAWITHWDPTETQPANVQRKCENCFEDAEQIRVEYRKAWKMWLCDMCYLEMNGEDEDEWDD